MLQHDWGSIEHSTPEVKEVAGVKPSINVS